MVWKTVHCTASGLSKLATRQSHGHFILYDVAVATIGILTWHQNLLFAHEVVIKCGCMAVPLCRVRNSSPIVWHPAVRVTISVVTAATQHLLLCTNRAQGEGECEGEREQQTSVDDYLTPDHRVIKAEPAPSTLPANWPSIHTSVILTAQWLTQGPWPTVLH